MFDRNISAFFQCMNERPSSDKIPVGGYHIREGPLLKTRLRKLGEMTAFFNLVVPLLPLFPALCHFSRLSKICFPPFAVSEDLLPALCRAVRSPPMCPLAAELGPWQSSMLYVGPAGTLAPCHWDALDNTFVQLHGRKDILLFPPTTPGMHWQCVLRQGAIS